MFSELLTCDYSTFQDLTEGIDYDTMMANKEAYADTELVTLKDNYKIGVLLNDTTSQESLEYQAYAKYLADQFGFTVTFSESTGGTPTEETNQIQTWASAGYDAVVSMSSGSVYDQADTCAANDMLFIMYAAQPTETERSISKHWITSAEQSDLPHTMRQRLATNLANTTLSRVIQNMRSSVDLSHLAQRHTHTVLLVSWQP